MHKIIKYASDLHLERFRSSEHAEHVLGIPKHSDILLIGGDTCPVALLPGYRGYIERLASTAGHVIYVLGNHEHWGGRSVSRNVEDTRMHLDGIDNLHVLENEHIDIDGRRYIGSTLWADLSMMSRHCKEQILRWADFNYVTADNGLVQTLDTIAALNLRAREYLVDIITSGIVAQCDMTVLTHFAPVWKFQDPQYESKPFGHFFYNNFDAAFQRGGMFDSPFLKHWAWGHTHASQHSRIGHTMVGCNPRGYYFGESGEFENHKFKWGSNF